MDSLPKNRWRRPVLLFVLGLALLYWLLPRLTALWLPGALAPYGFSNLTITLIRPGPQAVGVADLDFIWSGPDGLKLRFSTRNARYHYADDRLTAEQATLEVLQWPVKRGDAPSKPLSAWPLMPLHAVDIGRLHLKFDVDDQARQTDGRLKARLDPDGTSSLVLYVDKGLPDELPGRFELSIAADRALLASAGLQNGKTTSFYTEARLSAPPASGPDFNIRAQGNLKPFYRWLGRAEPDVAQFKFSAAGTLPSDYSASALLTGLKARSTLQLTAKNWQLPWGFAKDFEGSGTLNYEAGRGELSLNSQAVDALALRLPAFALLSRFERHNSEIAATGTISSVPLSAAFNVKHDTAKAQGELQLTRLKADLPALIGFAQPYLPAAARELSLKTGTAQGKASLHWLPHGPEQRAALRIDKATADVTLSAKALQWNTLTMPSLSLTLRAKQAGAELNAEGRLDSDALRTPYRLSQNLDSQRGRLTLSQLEGDLPALLALLQARLPPALNPLAITTGKMSADLRLDWQSGPARTTLQPSGRLAIKNLAGHYQALRWQGGEATLQLARLTPLRGEGHWQIARLDLPVGTPLNTLQGRFAASGTLDQPVLEFDDVAVQTLGGRLALAAVRYAPNQTVTLPLTLQALDLAEVLALVDTEGLSGQGKLSGELPVIWHAGKFSLGQGAHLDGLGSGTLRYRPAAAEAIAGSNEGSNIAMQALQDFRYKRLQAELTYSPLGDYGLKLALEGANPKLYEGYPIAFNLNLEGRLPGLLHAAVLSGDFSKHLLKTLNEEANKSAKAPASAKKP